MNFLETLFQPNENQKQIFEYVESSYFPWFFQEIIRNGSEEGKDSLYAHTLRLRHSDESLPVTGESNSGVTQTILFNEDKLTALKIIAPTKYKAVFFSSSPHAHKFCGYGERRLVFVVTFVGKIPSKEVA